MNTTKVISIDGVDYIRKDMSTKVVGDEVIIRTYSAGVHIGVIKERDSNEVTLLNARRLWKWAGAFTLNEVAMNGVTRKESRISKPVTSITVQWIEIIPVASGVDLSTTE